MKEKEIYDEEIKRMISRARMKPFSEYAVFMFKNAGYRFENQSGEQLQKWEAFGSDLSKLKRIKK